MVYIILQPHVLGTKKKSAKGVTKHVQQSLVHNDYLMVLSGGLRMRHDMVRITSRKHKLHAIKCAKISLTSFDDKRYINDNGIDTIPYCHYSLKQTEQMFIQNVCDDNMWGRTQEQLSGASSTNLFTPSPEPVNLFEAINSAWGMSPEDPGMNQSVQHDSDFDDDIFDFDNIPNSPVNLPRCLYIDDQAEEEQPRQSKKKRSKRQLIFLSDESQ